MSRTAVIYIRVNSLVLAFERTLSATLLLGSDGGIFIRLAQNTQKGRILRPYFICAEREKVMCELTYRFL